MMFHSENNKNVGRTEGKLAKKVDEFQPNLTEQRARREKEGEKKRVNRRKGSGT